MLNRPSLMAALAEQSGIVLSNTANVKNAVLFNIKKINSMQMAKHEYSWPLEVSRPVVEWFQDAINNQGYTIDELHQLVIRERAHWIKVFGTDEQGQSDMKIFADNFNKEIAHLINFSL